MMIFKLKFANLFVFLIMLTFVCDVLFPSKGAEVNRLVPQLVKVCIIISSFYYLLISRKKVYINAYLSYYFLLLLISILSFLYASLKGFSSPLLEIIKLTFYVVIIFVLYHLFYEDRLKQKDFEWLIVVGIVCYFLTIFRDFGREELFMGAKNYFVSNNAYRLLAFLPGVVLIRREALKVLLLSFIIIGVLMSLKRGAILIMFVDLLLIYVFMVNKSKKYLLYSLIPFLCLLFALFYYYFESLLYIYDVLMIRMQDLNDYSTAGSGRLTIYEVLVKNIFSNGPLNLIFGSGFMTSIEVLEAQIAKSIVAHSDFVEYLHNFGPIISLGLISFNYLVLYNTYKKQVLGICKLAATLFVFNISMQSLYSQVVFSADYYFAAITLTFLQFSRKYEYSHSR